MLLIRKSNPRLVVEQFMTYVGPYKKHILECDEDFFLNFETNLSKKDLTEENMVFGMKIKNIWYTKDITDTNKAHIWLYFQKLLKAGDIVMNA